MIRTCRAVAVTLGLAILIWQGGNAVAGRFIHAFLVPDLIVAAMLIASIAVTEDRLARIWLITAFLATAGVFAAATSLAIIRDGFSAGRLMTAIGLAPCLICAAVLRTGTR